MVILSTVCRSGSLDEISMERVGRGTLPQTGLMGGKCGCKSILEGCMH